MEEILSLIIWISIILGPLILALFTASVFAFFENRERRKYALAILISINLLIFIPVVIGVDNLYSPFGLFDKIVLTCVFLESPFFIIFMNIFEEVYLTVFLGMITMIIYYFLLSHIDKKIESRGISFLKMIKYRWKIVLIHLLIYIIGIFLMLGAFLRT